MSTNRREFLSNVALTALACGVNTNPTPQKYGCIDTYAHESHKRLTGETLHVYLDGEDVTAYCAEADDIKGYVIVYAKDERQFAQWRNQGGYYEGGRRFMVDGDVVIKPGAQL